MKTNLAMDKATSAYIETIWEEGDPKCWASDVLASLQCVVPLVKGHLTLSWTLVAAWNRHELPSRALPFTPQIAAGFAGALLLAGQAQLSAACIVGFRLLLRTGELCALTVDDVAISLDSDRAVVRLRDSKAGGRAGIFESVTVDDPTTILAFRFL